MTRKTRAPAGTWPSPLSAEALASANIRLAQPSQAGNKTYWLEGRPTEGGRSVLVECDEHGHMRDLTPAPYDVRSRVHEYGGSAYLVHDKQIYFINAKDQGVYRVASASIELVFQDDNLRFANLVLDAKRQRLIAVAERHGDELDEPQNFLASICLSSGSLSVVHEGADFYSSPTLNADCTSLAFLTWMHPNMPWDQTTLNLGTLDDTHSLNGLGAISESFAAFSPQFGPDDRLYYVSDVDNWWNLYVYNGSTSAQVTHLEAELGMPHWIFGMSTYGFVDAQTIVAACTENGLWRLVKIGLANQQVETIEPWEFTAIDHLSVSASGIACHAASPSHVDAIVRVTLSERGCSAQTLRSASDFSLDDAMISKAEPITFGHPDAIAYGFFYAPAHSSAALPEGDKPPLIVLVHGGPTTATSNGLNPRIQYWTTRGFAILDVNYRGSTGYGRTFRHSLHGKWGVADVEDCINGAQFLIDRGDVHADRVYIMGGSAGGYTVLGGLAFTDFFAGGISLYGVGDLALLCQDTHKFEARYIDTLVAPFDEDLYRSRSPLFSADKINAPVLFFQGSEDKMVPANQAETMVAALRDNQVPVGYVLFEGEGHGFRQSSSIITLMNTSLHFFLKIMGQDVPADATLDLYNEDRIG